MANPNARTRKRRAQRRDRHLPAHDVGADREPLAVKAGRNTWLWARTDRDGPQAADAIKTVAALMALRFGDMLLSPPVDLPGGGLRFFLSRVPLLDSGDNDHATLDVTASQDRQALALPAALQHWTHEADQPEPLAIRADRPWFVLVDFDWRGREFHPDEWPRQSLNAFGLPFLSDAQQLDLLLLDARHVGAPTRPDGGFLDEITPTLPKAPEVTNFFQKLEGVALLVILAWLAFNSKRAR